MKFSCYTFLAVSAALAAPASASSSVGGLRGGNGESTLSSGQYRRVLEATEGTFLMAEYEYLEGPGPGRPDKTLNVELPDGIYEIENAGPPDWALDLTSGDSRIVIPPGSYISGAKINLQGSRPENAGKSGGRSLRETLEEEESKTNRTPEQERNLAALRRQLAVTGQKSVLAVRVIHDGTTARDALTALAPTDDVSVIRREIFGSALSLADSVNLHDQYFACSHGELDFQPLISGPRDSTNANVTNIENGVVEVTVSTVCSSTCDGTMRNDVNNALANAFGVSASSLANHVMHCLPQGAMSGIAYAYINSWNSVYANKWCVYPSTQLHEIGHNIGLAHSGEASDQYDDRSGFMGYSYSQDEQSMCFNNAKNFQLGWFPRAWKIIGLNEGYNGRIKGQVNYNKNGDNTQDPVIIKVADPSSSNAIYIGFNHRVKHNSQSNEAHNQVTIQSYSGTGYSASLLIGKLIAGAPQWTYTLGSATVRVDVVAIDTALDTGYAEVRIAYGTTQAPTPSASPTAMPTRAPQPPTPPPTPVPTPLCTLAKIDESCTDSPDCCSGLCSGGKPANRVCLANGNEPPPSPTPPPPSPPTGNCEATGVSCTDVAVVCCNGCSGGKPSSRVCL